jgi:hypothetical protein
MKVTPSGPKLLKGKQREGDICDREHFISAIHTDIYPSGVLRGLSHLGESWQWEIWLVVGHLTLTLALLLAMGPLVSHLSLKLKF